MSKTLMIPGVYGQYEVWRKDIRPFYNRVESIVYCGNIVGTHESVVDNSFAGNNAATFQKIISSLYGEMNVAVLMGANEMMALNFPGEYISNNSMYMLQDIWLSESPKMQTATVVDGALCTHAGLTYGQWVSIGKPRDVKEVANRLNEKFRGTLQQGATFTTTGKPHMDANPFFASPYYELLPSWIGQEPCPFPQIYASGDMNTVIGRNMFHEPTSMLSFVDSVHNKKYGSHTKIGQTSFYGIDLLLNREKLTSMNNGRGLMIIQTKDEN